MQVRHLIAIGVLVYFSFGLSTDARSEAGQIVDWTKLKERSGSVATRPWVSRSWFNVPTDFCIYGGHNICTIPSIVKKPSYEPTAEPIRIKQIKPAPAGRYTNKEVFLLLSAAVYTAALIDMHHTYSQLHEIYEADPFARPLLRLSGPAFYTTGLVLATGANFLGWKMQRSKRFRKIWFLPQTLAIAGNVYGRMSSY